MIQAPLQSLPQRHNLRSVDTLLHLFRGCTQTKGMEQFKVIQMPFSPLLTTWSDTEDNMDELFISPRDYGTRQAYLRSYTFTRPEHRDDHSSSKVKHSLLRLKAAAWAAVTGKYRLPLRARLLKEKMLIRSQQYLSNGVQMLRPSCVQMPKCVMAA